MIAELVLIKAELERIMTEHFRDKSQAKPPKYGDLPC